jgi:TolA-binding protein
MGAAQIASIESAQPGSAAKPSASGASTTKASAAGPSYQQAISINLQGDTFGRAQLENLVGQLKLYQQDGGTILLQ